MSLLVEKLRGKVARALSETTVAARVTDVLIFLHMYGVISEYELKEISGRLYKDTEEVSEAMPKSSEEGYCEWRPLSVDRLQGTCGIVVDNGSYHIKDTDRLHCPKCGKFVRRFL